MPPYSVMLALKFVMRVPKNARSTLNMKWNTASVVPRHVASVPKNAGQWQELTPNLNQTLANK